MSEVFYKAVRKDGTSHWDKTTLWVPGKEINVDVPFSSLDGKPCGIGIHGSPTLLGAVGYQAGPSKYLTFTATSERLGSDKTKSRFASVLPGEYLSHQEVDALAGLKLWEANNPVNPLLLAIDERLDINEAAALCEEWDSVKASVRASVWDSVRASVKASVRASVKASVRASVWDSVWDSVWASVMDSVMAYTGGMFPGITSWKHAEHLGPDPWRPLLTLWYGGYVPSFDGTEWRLHAGPKAEVVWKGKF